jgi:plastocyanin
MKRIVFFAGSALALFALSASAVDHTVIARNGPRVFDPATLQIDVGDTVTFVNDPDNPGFHNVKSDLSSVTAFRCANGCDETGGNGDPSGDMWTATVAFPTAGIAPFYCEIHGGDGGVGMSGVITVGSVGAPVIEVDTTPLAGTAEEGASTSLPLAIGNSGDADLTWNVDTATTDCATPETIPWISLDPAAGTVVVGDPPATVNVTLDAATLTAGVYNANVCVHSNDTTNDLISVPVAFTVNIPDVIFDNGFDPVP